MSLPNLGVIFHDCFIRDSKRSTSRVYQPSHNKCGRHHGSNDVLAAEGNRSLLIVICESEAQLPLLAVCHGLHASSPTKFELSGLPRDQKRNPRHTILPYWWPLTIGTTEKRCNDLEGGAILDFVVGMSQHLHPKSEARKLLETVDHVLTEWWISVQEPLNVEKFEICELVDGRDSTSGKFFDFDSPNISEL